ncbi:hypothetical protein B0H21DRAFT_286620 [Amylocystis lapponica]|nr:hypothetical protein B0H21DRAFT_286620 [Amylocystis lapponica]
MLSNCQQFETVFNHPSLDPVGTTIELPVMFRQYHRRNRADSNKYAALPVFDTLPRELVPHWPSPYRPPHMHYGWVLKPEPLLEFAEQHDLLFRFSEPESDEDDEELGENKRPEPRRQLSPSELRSAKTLLVEERVFTMSQSLPELTLSLSPKPPKSLRIVTGHNANRSAVLSLYSNYDLPNIPSDEFINKLAKAMGYTEKPRWFLDGSRVTWMRWDIAW